MAIAYSTVFANFGKIIGRSNSYASLAAATLPIDLQAIVAQYGTSATTFGDSQGPIQGLTKDYQTFQNDPVKWRRKLDTYVRNTLTDADTVTSQLTGLSATDIRTVLIALIQDMTDKQQSVKANAVTLGAVSASSANVGNGTALADATLDGFNTPVIGGLAHVTYNGLASQLAVPSETMQLICTADSITGRTAEGAELWSWTGGPAYQVFDWHAEGSGPGPGLQTAHAVTTVPNLSWENFSVANTPDNWTIVTGAAGTDIFQETSAANVYRGTSALKFLGTGNTMPAIKYTIPAGLLNGRCRYLFTTRAKIAGVVGGGNLQVVFTGTGYSAGGSEQILQSLNGIGASYGLYQFWLNTPAVIPSDFAINIRVTGVNLGNGGTLWLDSGSFSPVTYFGGVNAQVVSGSTPWAQGDRLTFTVQNTTTGLFQDYARRSLKIQWPSKNDGTQTISDAGAS